MKTYRSRDWRRGGALAVAAAPALAGTWTGAYGNTIDATYTDGRTAKVFVEPDHTYSIKLPDGTVLKGTWADGAGQSCFTLTDPRARARRQADVLPAQGVQGRGHVRRPRIPAGDFTSVIHAGR